MFHHRTVKNLQAKSFKISFSALFTDVNSWFSTSMLIYCLNKIIWVVSSRIPNSWEKMTNFTYLQCKKLHPKFQVKYCHRVSTCWMTWSITKIIIKMNILENGVVSMLNEGFFPDGRRSCRGAKWNIYFYGCRVNKSGRLTLFWYVCKRCMFERDVLVAVEAVGEKVGFWSNCLFPFVDPWDHWKSVGRLKTCRNVLPDTLGMVPPHGLHLIFVRSRCSSDKYKCCEIAVVGIFLSPS